MYNSLVFEGGGVKGISYLGVVKYLEENKIIDSIVNYAGSSAGSHIATLLSIGYKFDELEDIFFEIPLNIFQSSRCGIIRDLIYFFKQYGYYDGSTIESYFDKIIKNKLGKAKCTFLEAFKITNNHLKISGTCLETRETIIFDYINYPNMPISKAVHISSAIPFFYKPVKFMEMTFVDGGCLNNFPIDVFNNDTCSTLGIELVSSQEMNDQQIENFKDFTMALVNTMHRKANKKYDLCERENIKIITINVGEISATDFNISYEEKNDLIKDGYNTIKSLMDEI